MLSKNDETKDAANDDVKDTVYEFEKLLAYSYSYKYEVTKLVLYRYEVIKLPLYLYIYDVTKLEKK